MKLLIFSDSHGNVANMEDAVRLERPDRVLHMGDILFFYRNIAENVEKRTEAFQKNRH